jgi:photosystem II stability/assembly factor-like uncharacterized protein
MTDTRTSGPINPAARREGWIRWWKSPRTGLMVATAVAIIVALGMGRELFEGEQHGEPGMHNAASRGDRSELAPTPRWVLASAAAPGNIVRWQVGADGHIERLAAGKPAQAMQSGVSEDLLSVSAPSAAVCWIVGRGGTVLRTDDGGSHWQKLPSPASRDLIGVTARNAREATVLAADSHRYATVDAGRTWRSQ